MQKNTVVLDDGSSQIKGTREVSGKIVEKVVTSSVVDDVRPGKNFDAHDGSWEIDGQKYTVDASFADRIPTNNSDRYQFSKMNTVLIHETLRQMGLGGKEVELCVTMPVNMFFKNNLRDKEAIEQKKSACMRKIENLAEHEPATITTVKVFPESVCAVWDWVYDDQGNEVNDGNRILVVDVGGTTTDISVVAGDDSIEYATTLPIGVEKIREKIADLMRDKNGISRPTAPQLDEILKNRSCGEDIIRKACAPAVRDIAQKLSTHQAAESYDAILYVGGGAELFGQALGEEYGGNFIVPKNPSMANARGIIKSMIAWK